MDRQNACTLVKCFSFSFLLLISMTAVSLGRDSILDLKRCVDKEKFEAGWRKYSDIDKSSESVPLESRSLEAQKIAEKQKEIEKAGEELTKLLANQELERQKRLALKDYEQTLTKGLKTNLLKSFWRLAWITYNTGQSGALAGSSIGKLLTEESASGIVALGGILSMVKKTVPKQYSKLPGAPGKVINVGVNAVIEGMKGLAEPHKMAGEVVTKIFETGAEEMLPEEEISEQDIEILRAQNEKHEQLKQAIAESYATSKQYQTDIDRTEAQIKEGQETETELTELEKKRVFMKLDQACNQPQPIKVTLSAPAQMAAGGVAWISATASGGSGNYVYNWIAKSEAGTEMPQMAGEVPTDEAEVHYQASGIGPHMIVVQVIDQESNDWGQAAAVIDVVEPGKEKPLTHITPPPKNNPSHPPVAQSNSLTIDSFFGLWYGSETESWGTGSSERPLTVIISKCKDDGSYFFYSNDALTYPWMYKPGERLSIDGDKLIFDYEGSQIKSSEKTYDIHFMEKWVMSVSGDTLTGQSQKTADDGSPAKTTKFQLSKSTESGWYPLNCDDYTKAYSW